MPTKNTRCDIKIILSTWHSNNGQPIICMWLSITRFKQLLKLPVCTSKMKILCNFGKKTLHWSAYRIGFCSHLQVTWVQLRTVMYTDGAKQRKCPKKTRWNGVKKIWAVLVCYERMRTNLKYVHKEDQMGNWLDEVCLKCCKVKFMCRFLHCTYSCNDETKLHCGPKNITSFFLNNSLKNELILIISGTGTWNPEKISHQKATNLSISPVKIAIMPWKIQKVIFQQ